MFCVRVLVEGHTRYFNVPLESDAQWLAEKLAFARIPNAEVTLWQGERCLVAWAATPGCVKRIIDGKEVFWLS